VRIRLPAAFRILVAAAVLCAAVYGFLAVGEAGVFVGELLSSWQLFPATAGALRAAAEGASIAALAAALSIALPLLLFSGIFGRWYCAGLCPLGSLQDLASRLGRGKKRFSAAANIPRALAALCAIALALLGSMSLASWLDPWSLFGRFMSYDLRPIVLLASREDVPSIGAWAPAAAAAAMAAILAAAVFGGRRFCGTLCPVGSILGLLNRIAPLRLRMESRACSSCGACASVCPASCIDPSRKRIDDSRCVYCLACVGACPTEALYYGRRKAAPEQGMSRARFLLP
jgi:polyferredoxin